MNLLVFTDLDGTLLDHTTYSFQNAIPAIENLRELQIPLILCSSKTKAEMLQIRKAISNAHPLICENGGAIYYPTDYFSGEKNADTELKAKFFGQNYERITSFLGELRKNGGYNFAGFSDLGVEGEVKQTGLPPEKALLALKRDCSEPIDWRDSKEKLARFKRTLRENGLRLIQGGRFYHVMGQFDKSDAMKYLHRKYEKCMGETIATAALGDAPNDQAMLSFADYPIIIAHQEGYRLKMPENQRVYYSKKTGPVGWAEAVFALLKKLNLIDRRE